MSERLSFREFMAGALYGASGFYASGGRAGRRGDFLTSPEVGPLFGAVVARFLDAEWERIGRPDPFTVVDAGAGPGTLARTVLAAEPACRPAMRYVAVEVSTSQRQQHPAGVASTDELPDSPLDGVVIANELLDNLPFRLVVFDGGWREAYVEQQPDGRYAEVLGPVLDPPPGVLPATAAHGARAPLEDDAAAWVAHALARLRSGALVVFDYATATTAELARLPWREWLRTYRGHARGGHYLSDPGSHDVTAQVALDQLPSPDVVTSQSDWLRQHGIDELVEEGKRYWDELASRPDLTAMQMRSRVSEAEALLDPNGLGAFTVCEWRAG